MKYYVYFIGKLYGTGIFARCATKKEAEKIVRDYRHVYDLMIGED